VIPVPSPGPPLRLAAREAEVGSATAPGLPR
jgi:hypothetical protein